MITPALFCPLKINKILYDPFSINPNPFIHPNHLSFWNSKALRKFSRTPYRQSRIIKNPQKKSCQLRGLPLKVPLLVRGLAKRRHFRTGEIQTEWPLSQSAQGFFFLSCCRSARKRQAPIELSRRDRDRVGLAGNNAGACETIIDPILDWSIAPVG